jgi:hypothetical protein
MRYTADDPEFLHERGGTTLRTYTPEGEMIERVRWVDTDTGELCVLRVDGRGQVIPTDGDALFEEEVVKRPFRLVDTATDRVLAECL